MNKSLAKWLCEYESRGEHFVVLPLTVWGAKGFESHAERNGYVRLFDLLMVTLALIFSPVLWVLFGVIILWVFITDNISRPRLPNAKIYCPTKHPEKYEEEKVDVEAEHGVG